MAVAGLGMAGLRLAESVLASPQTGYLVGMCDLNDNTLDTALPGSTALRSQSAIELLEIQNLDVLVIATPDNQHFELLMTALNAGVDVFCEKPVVTTRSELDSLHAKLSSTSLKLGTNTILRASPRFTQLKEMLRNELLGEIATFHGSYVYGRVHKIQQGWRGSYPEYSPTLGGGIHMLDLLNFLFEGRPTSVFAKKSNRGAKALSLNFHDTATALLTYPAGLIGTLSSIFASAHPHHHLLRLEGTKATFENRPTDVAQLWDFSKNPTEIDVAASVLDKGIVLHSFLATLREGSSPIVSTDEAIDALSAAIAIEESIKTENEVVVPYYDPLNR